MNRTCKVVAWLSCSLFAFSVHAEREDAQGRTAEGLVASNEASVRAAILDVVTAVSEVSAGSVAGADGEAGDMFGGGVSIDGDTAVIGAIGDDRGPTFNVGSVYVLERVGGEWQIRTKLLADDGEREEYFGGPVALRGDTVLVGSPNKKVDGRAEQGAVYVFERSGSEWSQVAKLTASDGGTSDRFGGSLAWEGATLLIGARGHNVTPNGLQGAVYVFSQDDQGWTETGKLTDSEGEYADWFGSGIVFQGDTALISAPLDDVGANDDQGSVLAFVRSGSEWTPQGRLVASDGAAFDHFGSSYSLELDRLIIGAPGVDATLNGNEGAAYVYERSGGVWSQRAKLAALSSERSDAFGGSVSLKGDTVLVGAPGKNVGLQTFQGAVYVFENDGSQWREESLIVAPDGALGDRFSSAYFVEDDEIWVSTIGDDYGFDMDRGSVYIFRDQGSDWALDTTLTSGDGSADMRFGEVFDQDGDTLVVGLPYEDVGTAEDQGIVLVYVREREGWRLQARLTAADGAEDDLFGSSVAIEGDELLVGSPSDDLHPNVLHQGSVYVFRRVDGAWTPHDTLTSGDPFNGYGFGRSVELQAGTALVGASRVPVEGAPDQGGVFVFIKDGDDWVPQARLVANTSGPLSQFGASLALDGDLALIGTPEDFIGGHSKQGSVYAFGRHQGVWVEEARIVADDGQTRDLFGTSVSLFGDMALIGAPFNNMPDLHAQGAAYVFAREMGSWSQQAKLVVDEGQSGDFLGFSVALQSDFAVVGAMGVDFGSPFADRGAAYVFSRNDALWSPVARLVAPGAQDGDQIGFGIQVDGHRAYVSAPYADGLLPFGGRDEGKVYEFACIRGGMDARVTIEREQGGAMPLHMGQKGLGLARFVVRVDNRCGVAAQGIRLRVAPVSGLNDVLWSCDAPCTPPEGAGPVDTFFDLDAGASLRVDLSGTIDGGADYLELTAEVSVPPGEAVLDPQDDRFVYIEPVGVNALLKNGFE